MLKTAPGMAHTDGAAVVLHQVSTESSDGERNTYMEGNMPTLTPRVTTYHILAGTGKGNVAVTPREKTERP